MIKLLLTWSVLIALTDASASISIGGAAISSSDGDYLAYVRYLTVPPESQSGSTWEAGNNVSSKSTAEIQAIVVAIKALEGDPIRREIYEKMDGTTAEGFEFRDLAHAKSVFLQRTETIRMMKEFNTGVYTYATRQNPAHTTASHWQNGTKHAHLFSQKDGTPYDAITQLCATDTRTYGECLGGIIACIWWGASRGMGPDTFNALYSELLNMDQKFNTTWSKNIKQAEDRETLVPGDWVYFNNSNYRTVITQKEFWKKGWLDSKRYYLFSGENALFFGGNRFEGLGISSRTATEMRQEIKDAYNNDLDTVIKEVAKLGGTYNGIEIEAITDDQMQTRIETTSLRRLIN